MKDEQIVKTARDFRQGMIGWRSSFGCCALICAPLAGLLEFYKVPCELVESDVKVKNLETNHIFIRLRDGRVLDPTADQFNPYTGKGWPPVYLGKPLAIHKNPVKR